MSELWLWRDENTSVRHNELQRAPAKVQVWGLDVKYFANVGGQLANPDGQFDQPRGVLGKDSFATRRGDSVTVEARLSRAKGREVSGKTTVVELMDWLRQAPEVEAVAAVGFAVLPKDRR
jgi:hypothetical protein